MLYNVHPLRTVVCNMLYICMARPWARLLLLERHRKAAVGELGGGTARDEQRGKQKGEEGRIRRIASQEVDKLYFLQMRQPLLSNLNSETQVVRFFNKYSGRFQSRNKLQSLFHAINKDK